MRGKNISRRGFLKASVVSAVGLQLSRLLPCPFGVDEAAAGVSGSTGGLGGVAYSGWQQLRAQHWTWDRTAKVTHCVDCYPGQCSWTAYVKDNVVIREEQTGHYPQLNPDLPDMNPRGCQKGASFGDAMYGKERLRYPLIRVGERGSGKWKRISWDEALTKVADAIVEAQQTVGPESVVLELGPGNIGIFQMETFMQLGLLQGMTLLDTNGLINDFNIGQYITFGKFHQASSVDDWFNAEVVLIWHKNPIYTRIPSYHFISEARYNGSQIVTIAPDASPSTIHADLYVPVDFGADAALALSMAQVMIAEGLVDEDFVKEQTDLALLVRSDNEKFLRASDMEKGGADNEFYLLDANSGMPAKAPRASLALDGLEAVLDGEAQVTLADGTRVEVRTVFSRLREALNAGYTPEQASKVCKTAPSLIRKLARMIATKRSLIILGWNSAKYYHGDLIERAQSLVLALSGNWGRPGTGSAGWNQSGDAKHLYMARKTLDESEHDRIVAEHSAFIERLRKKDPAISEEMGAIEYERLLGPLTSMVPPIFYWYHHAGYDQVWNKREWGDPAMKRPFEDYMKEAMDKDWWHGVAEPAAGKTPQVLIGIAGSTLRRTRGGLKQLLTNTWPKLKTVVSIDPRMSTTCMYSDLVLPPAWFYEREDFRFHSPSVTYCTYTDRAVDPLGDCITEWEIAQRLSRTIRDRAASRGHEKFHRSRKFSKELLDLLPGPLQALYRLLGDSVHDRIASLVLPGLARHVAVNRSYDEAHELMTKGQSIDHKGYMATFTRWISDQSRLGLYPQDATLDKYKKEGFVRMTGLDPLDPVSLNTSCDIEPDKTIVAMQWHVRDKVPYPTMVHRAQFYIDHDWFLEAGEAMPVHKDHPRVGGDHPLRMTSGHLRWSIHSIWVVNKLIQRTHRGRPGLFINPRDAAERGIADGDLVEVFNDFNEFQVHAITSPGTRPGQVIIYHAWEPYQFPKWKSYDAAIPGMIKYLHLAGGYGHLRYWRWNWQPVQSDRAIAVNMRKAV